MLLPGQDKPGPGFESQATHHFFQEALCLFTREICTPFNPIASYLGASTSPRGETRSPYTAIAPQGGNPFVISCDQSFLT